MSGVRLSRLGFGGAPIGGLFHTVPEETAYATVQRAHLRGMRYFDTAPHYGAGLAERRLGRALTGLPRDSFVISTKVGRRLDQGADDDMYGFAEAQPYHRVWDFSAGGIRRTLEASMGRLGIDHVDIVYLHDPDDHEREVYETAFPALAALRDEGVVGAIGLGMNQTAMPARLVRDLDLDVVLCAGRYTLLDQSALDSLLPACLSREVTVVIGGVYNSGMLADPRPNAMYNYAPAAPSLVERTGRLRAACANYGVPLRAAALRFPIGHPAVASVLVGCRHPREVDDNTTMFEYPIPDQLWTDLKACGLIPQQAPLPERRGSPS